MKRKSSFSLLDTTAHRPAPHVEGQDAELKDAVGSRLAVFLGHWNEACSRLIMLQIRMMVDAWRSFSSSWLITIPGPHLGSML